MAFERQWAAVVPVAFTAQGTRLGIATVTSTAGFKVKQLITVSDSANALPDLALQVLRVLSPTTMVLGPKGSDVDKAGSDLSAYGLTCYCYAQMQPKAGPSLQEIDKAAYEQEPTVAYRTVWVDQFGNFISSSNPLPVTFDGTVTLGDVSIIGNGNTMAVNPDGSINVVVEAGAGRLTVPQYQHTPAVASGVETTLNTVVGSSVIQGVLSVRVSGEMQAYYRIYLNGNVIAAGRTYWGDFDRVFDIAPSLALSVGDVLKVTALYSSSLTGPGDFDCTIYTN